MTTAKKVAILAISSTVCYIIKIK